MVNSCGDAYKDKGILQNGKNMLNPISAAFEKAKQENRPALLTYTVAGDSIKTILEILKSISKNADILELEYHITHLLQMEATKQVPIEQ